MKIRGFTVFAQAEADLARLAALARDAEAALPLSVQVRRFALPPFPQWLPDDEETAVRELSQTLERIRSAGFGFTAIGPVQLSHDHKWIQRLPRFLSDENRPFACVEIADGRQIDPQRCRALAECVRALSTADQSGFANMYLTAVANCAAGTPFFPGAWHRGGGPSFALAIQAADLALDAVRSVDDVADVSFALRARLESECAPLVAACDSLAQQHGVEFAGIDLSLAPYPDEQTSIGAALEAISGAKAGDSGSLFATGLLAAAIQDAALPKTGFSGVMLPVLEDNILALRAQQGLLGINDLLLASSVCGTGLDTIPLPGDSSCEQLQAIYLDLAMLATRLDKPLTARLMPIPGAIPGDMVDFDSEYFSSGAVMAIPGEGFRGLKTSKPIQIPKRNASAP